jgi:hypothetical protein
MSSVALIVPVGGTRNAKCWNVVVPKRMAVALAFDQRYRIRLTRVREAVQSVEARLAAGFPAKAIAVERDPEACCQLFASPS